MAFFIFIHTCFSVSLKALYFKAASFESSAIFTPANKLSNSSSSEEYPESYFSYLFPENILSWYSLDAPPHSTCTSNEFPLQMFSGKNKNKNSVEGSFSPAGTCQCYKQVKNSCKE